MYHKLNNYKWALFNFTYNLSLSILMASFPGEPGLASFIGAKDDGSGGGNRSYKMFKAPGP